MLFRSLKSVRVDNCFLSISERYNTNPNREENILWNLNLTVESLVKLKNKDT